MAKAATKTKATPAAPPAELDADAVEHRRRMAIGRTIGRGVWLTGFKAENPTATKEDRQAAWVEARKDFTKIGLKALKTLEKTGYTVTGGPNE